jgi:hypothetical protein
MRQVQMYSLGRGLTHQQQQHGSAPAMQAREEKIDFFVSHRYNWYGHWCRCNGMQYDLMQRNAIQFDAKKYDTMQSNAV